MSANYRAPMHGRSALPLVVMLGCAHGEAAPCPAPAVRAPVVPTQAAPAAASEPLELFAITWLLGAGDSGALTELVPTVDSFTLGRWECAVGSELADDSLSDGRVEVRRHRKMVCTHASGLTMQTAVSCRYDLSPALGTAEARGSAREARITLSEAPEVVLMCEPRSVPQLALYRGERQAFATVCIANGRPTRCVD